MSPNPYNFTKEQIEEYTQILLNYQYPNQKEQGVTGDAIPRRCVNPDCKTNKQEQGVTGDAIPRQGGFGGCNPPILSPVITFVANVIHVMVKLLVIMIKRNMIDFIIVKRVFTRESIIMKIM